MPTRRPTWLPHYLPELQGLRGLAILAVVLYHSKPRFEGTWAHYPILWGWAGVDLFFVLSGFLITGILLEARTQPRYFRNFYMRRVLRIWPVYVLVLVVAYGFAPWFLGDTVAHQVRMAPWPAYALLLQNLLHTALPAAIGPTWSLAIEEQFYLLWAPVVRFLRPNWLIAAIAAILLIASPALRLSHLSFLNPTNTLIHLDGIALGSLLALGLHTLAWSRRAWLRLGIAAAIAGFWATATIAAGTAFLDSALALAFAGAVLAAIAGTGARNPIAWMLRHGPLPFYGRISYGLYMTHILVFIYFGWFDLKMDPYGISGNLAVVAFRLAACTLIATGLWFGYERPILRCKRFF